MNCHPWTPTQGQPHQARAGGLRVAGTLSDPEERIATDTALCAAALATAVKPLVYTVSSCTFFTYKLARWSGVRYAAVPFMYMARRSLAHMRCGCSLAIGPSRRAVRTHVRMRAERLRAAGRPRLVGVLHGAVGGARAHVLEQADGPPPAQTPTNRRVPAHHTAPARDNRRFSSVWPPAQRGTDGVAVACLLRHEARL